MQNVNTVQQHLGNGQMHWRKNFHNFKQLAETSTPDNQKEREKERTGVGEKKDRNLMHPRVWRRNQWKLSWPKVFASMKRLKFYTLTSFGFLRNVSSSTLSNWRTTRPSESQFWQKSDASRSSLPVSRVEQDKWPLDNKHNINNMPNHFPLPLLPLLLLLQLLLPAFDTTIKNIYFLLLNAISDIYKYIYSTSTAEADNL